MKYVLTYTATAVLSTSAVLAHAVVLCLGGWKLDIFPHLVQGHCANQAVLYGAGEQVGAGFLDQHTYDVAPGAEIGRCAAPNSVCVCCVEIDVCFVFLRVFHQI